MPLLGTFYALYNLFLTATLEMKAYAFIFFLVEKSEEAEWLAHSCIVSKY